MHPKKHFQIEEPIETEIAVPHWCWRNVFSVQRFECESDVVRFKQQRTNGRSNYESREGYQKSPRLLQMMIFCHGGSIAFFGVVSFQVQTEVSFLVASLSFSSAHVNVDHTVVVRVILD